MAADLEIEHVVGVAGGLLRGIGELDAAGLHPAAAQHLRLDHDGPADLLGDPSRLVRGLGEPVLGDGNSRLADDRPRFVFEEAHRKAPQPSEAEASRVATASMAQRVAEKGYNFAEVYGHYKETCLNKDCGDLMKRSLWIRTRLRSKFAAVALAAVALGGIVAGCGGSSDSATTSGSSSSSGGGGDTQLNLVAYSTPKKAYDALTRRSPRRRPARA